MFKIFALFILILFPFNLYAATDGTLGTTSTGTATITVTIPKLIRARSFSDFSFGSYPGAGDLNANDDLNISINYTPGTYRVVATGSGTGGAFTVTDGTSTVAYNAYFNDQTGTTGRVALTAGTAVTAQGGAVTPLGSTTLNSNISIEFLEANLLSVGAATYNGSISLAFQPE